MNAITVMIRAVLLTAVILAAYLFLRPSSEEEIVEPAEMVKVAEAVGAREAVRTGDAVAGVEAVQGSGSEMELSEPVLQTQQTVSVQAPKPRKRKVQPANEDALTADDHDRGDAILFEIDALSSTPFD